MFNPQAINFLLHCVENQSNKQCPKSGKPLRLKVLQREAALRSGSYQTEQQKSEQFKAIFKQLKEYYFGSS